MVTRNDIVWADLGPPAGSRPEAIPRGTRAVLGRALRYPLNVIY